MIIMLKEKRRICVLWTYRKLLTGSKESVGMGNEEERNTRSFV